MLRVAYNWEEDKLVRLHWPVMDRTLSTPPVRAELLDGVDNVEVRFLDTSGEWHLDWPPLQMNGPQRLVARPRAVEFAIELKDFGRVFAAGGDERMSTRAQQRGVAVLMAMLVVTIGTIIAVNLMWQGTLDLRRTESALAADQGLMYVQGAEAWAADILRQDLVDSPESDHLGEQWAIELPPLPSTAARSRGGSKICKDDSI